MLNHTSRKIDNSDNLWCDTAQVEHLETKSLKIPRFWQLTVRRMAIVPIHFPLHPGRMRGRVNLFQLADGNLRLNLRGFELGMAKHRLDVANIGTTLKHYRGHRVPEQVTTAALPKSAASTYSRTSCVSRSRVNDCPRRIRNTMSPHESPSKNDGRTSCR
jgi:hypothetical protein